MADRERYPDNKKEERGCGVGKKPPEAVLDIERHNPEKGEIEDGMKKDHHQDGNTPEDIDLGVRAVPLMRSSLQSIPGL